MLDDGVRVLALLLAGPQGGAGPRGAGGDHAARHVHHPGQHPELPAPGGIHQGEEQEEVGVEV